MGLAIAAYQQPVLSIPDSPSVICTNLPVHQESLDSMRMTHTEGGWGTLEIIVIGIILCALWPDEPEPEPEPDNPCSISISFDDNEMTAEIDCGEEEEDGG